MRRWRFIGLLLLAGLLLLWATSCGGHRPAGPSPFVARVNLSPSGASSLQLGNTLSLTASAQNAAGNSIGGTFTFASSDTSIVNVAPNGVVCAGVWSTNYTVCNPGASGAVTVTATNQGVTSAPTWIFVHPVIDEVDVSGILLDGQNIQEPCLPQGQTMSLQARAFSHGVEITQSVGPFTWSANNPTVVGFSPINNIFYNFPTNQATAKANNPGITQIFATASGVTSTTFQQPNEVPVVFDFFETCPIENITLEIGHAGSGQTTFAAAKGTSQTVIATVTDVLGNSSLPNPGNAVVLSRIPLTWTATQPGSVSAGSGCTQSCALSTPSVGAGAVTASCTPPTCNVEYPLVPKAFATPAALQACQQALSSIFPQITSCQPFIPKPVYATTAISGIVTGSGTGSAGSFGILATSLECALNPPDTCGTGIYSFSSARAVVGNANLTPNAPNSILFDLAGDRAYMGSNFGAQLVNPNNFGSSTNPFTALGTVTGRILAISANGTSAIFTDTVHEPNQVYVVNTANALTPAITPLNISGAGAAAFSPDGLKAFIFGFDANGYPNLYIYSTLQALQTIPLAVGTSVNAITFSTNGAFAYVVSPSIAGGGPAFTVYNTCDNQVSTTPPPVNPQQIALAAAPVAFRALPDGIHFIALESDGGLEVFTAQITGIAAATPTNYASAICPMHVSHPASLARTINLGVGTLQPLNFFVSPDGTLLYIVATNNSDILVYNFYTGAVNGIPLKGPNNPTPLTADMSVDGTTILVAATDGMLHEVSTAFGGTDSFQIAFPNLPNYSNPFCTITLGPGPCVLNFIAARP